MSLRIYFILLFSILVYLGMTLKKDYFTKNLITQDTEIFIDKTSSYESLKNELSDLSQDMNWFSSLFFNTFLSQKRLEYWMMNGRYVLKKNSSLNDIVNKLRSRSQDPIKFTFNSIDEIDLIFGILQNKFEVDSIDFVNFFNEQSYSTDSLFFLLIPNTYEMYWDISPSNFFQRVNLEYNKFWTSEKLDAANKINLSKEEVFILASIVHKEASHFDEMPRIAGLYLNRIKEKWPLAADPTISYIWKKQNGKQLKRIRNKHIKKTKDSPFNTYHNLGLPPFPICVPSLQSIESVLFAEEHDFFYMCAKSDRSEYHNFAKTEKEHLSNARQFHSWLNSRKIY